MLVSSKRVTGLSSSPSYTMLNQNGKVEWTNGDMPNKESTSNRSFPQEIDMVAGVRHNPREEREKGMMRRLSQADLKNHTSNPKPTIDQIYSSIVQNKSESKIVARANGESLEDDEESSSSMEAGLTNTKSLKPVPESSVSSSSFIELDLDDDDDDGISNKDSPNREGHRTDFNLQDISSQHSMSPNNSNGKMMNTIFLRHRHICYQDPLFKLYSIFVTAGHVELSSRLKTGSHTQNVRRQHNNLKLVGIILCSSFIAVIHKQSRCVYFDITQGNGGVHKTVDPMDRQNSYPRDSNDSTSDENMVVYIPEHEEELHIDDVESISDTIATSETEVYQGSLNEGRCCDVALID